LPLIYSTPPSQKLKWFKDTMALRL